MLTALGRLIEIKPWFVIIGILLITVGFATLIPALEFKTDFKEFMPDDELVLANSRVLDYFGASQFPLFLLVEKQRAESIITPQAVREMYFIEKELKKLPKVNGTIAITTLLNPVCLIEFGKTIDNCTDEQIEIALQDMLMEEQTGEIQIFYKDDPNEAIDYKRYPRISKGKSIDSADIKNCYVSKDTDTITFSIEVYDLSDLESKLRPSLTKVNVMEWYLDFENLIKPDERLDVSYRIAAHIEPTHPLWEIGKGVIGNLRELFQLIRDRELFNSYKKEAYLWIKPPQQTTYLPIQLNTGNITFDNVANRINIVVSREELGTYGIATRIGSFELPAKLSNFNAGVRYYQTSILKGPGARASVNTSFLLSGIEKIRSRPILGSIAARILQKYGNMTWEDFDQLFAMMKQTDLLPETFALQDIDSTWTKSDVAPDIGISNTNFFIYPYLFSDIQVNSLAFLSKDYEQTHSPIASLIIVQLDFFDDYNELLKTNEEVLNKIIELDKKFDYVTVEVTGENVISSQINELTSDANQILGPSMFIIIIIILFIFFRRMSYVFLPMLTLGVSTIWLLGTMTLLGISFNVMAVALIPLILGIGVDYSVHLLHNYRAELEKGNTPAEAIKRSVKDIGTAMFLAWLTTFIAFMSFLSSSIPPIRHFGILLALGITYTFITAITLSASIRYILDRRKTPKIKSKFSSFSSKVTLKHVMEKISSIVLSHQKKIILAMVLITLVFASGAVQLERGFDMDQFLPENNPAMELFNTIADYFPYASEYQEYIFIEGSIATVESIKGIAQTHRNIEDDTFVSRNTDGSIKVTSIYSVIQNAVKNNQSMVNEFNIDEKTGIPKTDEDVQALLDYLYEGSNFNMGDVEMGEFDMGELGSSEIQMVLYKTNSRYTATIIRYYLDASFQLEGGNLQDDLELLNKEINEDVATYGDATAITTGNSIIQLSITTSLTSSQFASTGISLALAAFVLILVYRKPTLGLIAMIPVSISIIWILGTMYYFGYILDVMTVTVTSITIGIGIDYAIHAIERFRLVADKTGDIEKAVCETISHTGGALLIAALTTALAFGILVLAPIPPEQRFGIILAIMITYSFLTSVLFLPLFLARWAKWQKKRKGFIISPGPPKDDIDSQRVS